MQIFYFTSNFRQIFPSWNWHLEVLFIYLSSTSDISDLVSRVSNHCCCSRCTRGWSRTCRWNGYSTWTTSYSWWRWWGYWRLMLTWWEIAGSIWQRRSRRRRCWSIISGLSITSASGMMIWQFFKFYQNWSEWSGSHLLHFNKKSLASSVTIKFLFDFP